MITSDNTTMKTLHKCTPEQREAAHKDSSIGIFLCTHCVSIIQYSNLDLWFVDGTSQRYCDCPECGYTVVTPVLGGKQMIVTPSFKVEDGPKQYNRKIARRRIGKAGWKDVCKREAPIDDSSDPTNPSTH